MTELTQNISFRNYLENVRFSKDEILAFVNQKQDIYKEAIELVIYGEHPLAWRSAWVLTHVFSKKDIRLKPYCNVLLQIVPNAKPDGFQRELLRLIQKSGIEEENIGEITNICFDIWESVKKIPSVRIIALKILIEVSDLYPELKQELLLITENHGFIEGSGMASSAKILRTKLIKDCKKLEINNNNQSLC